MNVRWVSGAIVVKITYSVVAQRGWQSRHTYSVEPVDEAENIGGKSLCTL